MKHKFYLFDFDGTLVDSMPTFCGCVLRILDENHIPYPPDITKILTPLGLNGTAEYFRNTMGLQVDKDKLTDLIMEYLTEAYFYTIPAKANVLSTLKALKEQGASLNILTASPHITLDACARRVGLWELFDNVWSCDDFGTTKADPQIYAQVAEKLGTAVENVLFLDDNIHANLVAKSAGMQVCGVFDPSSEDMVEQMKAATDYYIFDFKELLSL